MIFWWQGRGYVVLLLAAGCAILGAWGQEALMGDTRLPFGLSFGLAASALPLQMYVQYLQKNASVAFDHKRQGVYKRPLYDSLFSVRIYYWPKILLGLGAIAAVLTWYSARQMP
jgi:hypothetical protein